MACQKFKMHNICCFYNAKAQWNFLFSIHIEGRMHFCMSLIKVNISEQLMYLPPPEYRHQNVEVKRNKYILKYYLDLLYLGKRCSTQENSSLERSFVLGWPQARQGSLSKGGSFNVPLSCALEASKGTQGKY